MMVIGVENHEIIPKEPSPSPLPIVIGRGVNF
jgi:hypothetical protein